MLLIIVFNYEGDSIKCSKAIDAKDVIISNPTLIWVRECYDVPNQAHQKMLCNPAKEAKHFKLLSKQI